MARLPARVAPLAAALLAAALVAVTAASLPGEQRAWVVTEQPLNAGAAAAARSLDRSRTLRRRPLQEEEQSGSDFPVTGTTQGSEPDDDDDDDSVDGFVDITDSESTDDGDEGDDDTSNNPTPVVENPLARPSPPSPEDPGISDPGANPNPAPGPTDGDDFDVQEENPNNPTNPAKPPPQQGTPTCHNGGVFPLCDKAPVQGTPAPKPNPKPAQTNPLAPKPSPKPQPKPEPKPEPKPDPKPEAKPEPTQQPKPEPKPEPSPSPPPPSPPPPNPSPPPPSPPPPSPPPPSPPPPAPTPASPPASEPALAPPPPVLTPVEAAAYSNFSYQVLNNLGSYSAEVQEQLVGQLAEQVGVRPNQVSLTLPGFQVSCQVVVAGYPAGYEQDVQQGLLLYLDVPRPAANITIVSTSSGGGRRKMLRTETATLSVIVAAADGTQAVAVANKLNDDVAMTRAIRNYLATRTELAEGFDAVGEVPQASAPTTVSVALTAADVAANKDESVANMATPTNMQSLLISSGMPPGTLVSITATPNGPALPPSPTPSGVPSPVPSPTNASTSGSSVAVWVWAVIGVCAGLAIVAAAFITFVLCKRKRGAVMAPPLPMEKRSSQRSTQNGAMALKDEDFIVGGSAEHRQRQSALRGGGGYDGAAAAPVVVPVSATGVAMQREASPPETRRVAVAVFDDAPPPQQQVEVVVEPAELGVGGDEDDGTPMPLAISADEAQVFHMGSRLPADQEQKVRQAAAAAAAKQQPESMREEAVSAAAVPAVAATAAAERAPEITPAALEEPAPEPEPAPVAAVEPAAAPSQSVGAAAAAAAVAAGATVGGGLGGLMRKLTGSRGSRDMEKAAAAAAAQAAAEEEAAREAAAAAAAAPPPAPATASPTLSRQPSNLTPRDSSSSSERAAMAAAAAAAITTASPKPSPRPSSRSEISPADVVMVTPPGGGPPVPMLPLSAMPLPEAGSGSGLRVVTSPSTGKPTSGRRQSSGTPSRAGSVSGERPPRPRRQGSFSNASAYEQPRRPSSISGRSESGSEAQMQRMMRGFAPGEEEEVDEWPLGAVEQPPASLRAPGAGVVSAFVSDRLKHETTSGDGILTKIVTERTAHLRPGTQFIKSFWMTEGVRTTSTSVVRNAVHKVNKQPVSIKFYGRMEDFVRERKLYSQAISPQFVPLMYFCEEGSEDLPPFIITERGDFTLADVLRKSRPPPQQQKILLHDVACALSQLHSMGLVQMDIRPANVMFFGKEGAWKLVDFENWAWNAQPTDVSYALRYAAPEIPAADLAGEASIPADPCMDMFALGVLAFEVMTGKRFYGAASDSEVLLMLMGHKPLPSEGEHSVLGQVLDRNAQRLLRHLIRRSPSARWDAGKVASCQWLKSSDFQAYRVTG